ncbi:L-serine ammonia-lyase [Salinisphaera orenii]|uniref:L-serine dehydratase n=1 Tax=Salinisphaera orenii YIM 95161 TaxID=1051139 RepID=A0A423PHR0_9GAMM|nr:L-serine ammonia-lyase [Salinisphaera halophila]ROO25120.1 serine dehydratase [Salinisphaera halophila YIM 95161]
MSISVFELFRIGIGPSSSHTVGPMRAALTFAEGLSAAPPRADVARVTAELFGSLGATGRGHGSDRAVMLGLAGERPESVDPDTVDARIAAVRADRVLTLAGGHRIDFDAACDVIFNPDESLPAHPNGLRLTARDGDGALLCERTWYSVGGGFVVEAGAAEPEPAAAGGVPYAFDSADGLLSLCTAQSADISDVMLANESALRDETEVRAGLLAIWRAMADCVAHGLVTPGELPGPLRVRRRAPGLYRDLSLRAEDAAVDGLATLDWVNLYALAVNEENAAGGRVVTAPTNGAAGIVPAVLHYYVRFIDGANDDGIVRFLLTAGAIGALYKQNASISGAEVGCQGEVGVACSMAAGALAERLGGSPAQVENAAEIGMEHNLGLTCDPVGGLVQVPCIERNAMGAIKAINAARMALRGDGRHCVSLDKVIRTMRDTGADMSSRYKETARGGLAVNVIEC